MLSSCSINCRICPSYKHFPFSSCTPSLFIEYTTKPPCIQRARTLFPILLCTQYLLSRCSDPLAISAAAYTFKPEIASTGLNSSLYTAGSGKKCAILVANHVSWIVIAICLYIKKNPISVGPPFGLIINWRRGQKLEFAIPWCGCHPRRCLRWWLPLPGGWAGPGSSPGCSGC